MLCQILTKHEKKPATMHFMNMTEKANPKKGLDFVK